MIFAQADARTFDDEQYIYQELIVVVLYNIYFVHLFFHFRFAVYICKNL